VFDSSSRHGNARTRLNSAFCASTLGRLHDLNLPVWCVVRSLIVALTACLVNERIVHEPDFLEWRDRFARMDVAAVLQNGTCAIEMVTIHAWPMTPNQTRADGATFTPNGNVFTTNNIFSDGRAMRSLRFHARGSTDAGQRLRLCPGNGLSVMVSFSPTSTRNTMNPVNVDCQIQCRLAGRAQNKSLQPSRKTPS
jgi:hypothetical protein